MNKQKIKAYMFLLWAAFSISGCSGSRNSSKMYLEAKTQEDSSAQADDEIRSNQNQSSKSDGRSNQNQSLKSDSGSGRDQLSGSDDRLKQGKGSDGKADAGILDNSLAGAEAENDTCFVYVCGAVKRAGVFELPSGSRVYEAIALAGGFCKNAYEKGINQARQIQDGDMIEVLTKKEQKELEQDSSAGASAAGSVGVNVSDESDAGTAADGLIDINTADAAQLMTLNGIGEAKAASIISYRESSGGFSAIEEIKNVSGIGEGVYAKIQDKIKVS